MLSTTEYDQIQKVSQSVQDVTQAQAGLWGADMFPFKGTQVTGYYAPPFIWEHIEQDRGTAWKALDLRSNVIASLQWYAKKRMPNGKIVNLTKDLPNHFAPSLIRNPGGPYAYRTQTGIWRLIYKWYVIAGNSYNLGVLATDGPYRNLPVALWPMEPNNITLLPSQGEQFRPGFRYTTPRGVFFYKPGQVFQIRREEPTPYFIWNLYFGQPEYKYYGHAIDTEWKALMSQDYYFDNNGIPSVAYKTPFDPTGEADTGAYETNIELYRQQQHERLVGPQNSGKDTVLPPGWDPVLLDGGKREVNFLQSVQALRQYIATCEGTALSLLDGEFHDKHTADAVTANLLKHTIFPDARQIAQSMSLYLQQFEDGIEVDFVDPILAPIEDRVMVVNTMKTIVGGLNANTAGHILMHEQWVDTKEGELYTGKVSDILYDDIASGKTLPQKDSPNVENTEGEAESGVTGLKIPKQPSPSKEPNRETPPTKPTKSWVPLPLAIQDQFYQFPDKINGRQEVLIVFDDGTEVKGICMYGRQVQIPDECKELRITEVRIKKV